MCKEDGLNVLIVEDDLASMTLLQEHLLMQRADCARTVGSAHAAVLAAERARSPHRIDFIDLRLLQDSGAEFARKVMEIIVRTNVVIVTSDERAVANLSFKPDGTLIKGDYNQQTVDALVAELAKPKRNCPNSPDDIRIRELIWKATEHMHGIDELAFVTRRLTGPSKDQLSENYMFRTTDGYLICCVVCPPRSRDGKVVCRVSVTIGCNQRCPSCLYHRVRGRASYVRPLTLGEIMSQAYTVVTKSSLIREAFSQGNGVEFATTGEGDCLVNNSSVFAQFVLTLTKNEVPEFSFFLATTGNVTRLREWSRLHGKLPRVELGLSLYSTKSSTREHLIPGSKGQSPDELLDQGEEFTRLTGKRVRLNVPVIKRNNDSAGYCPKGERPTFHRRAVGRLLRKLRRDASWCPEYYSGRSGGFSTGTCV